MSHAFRCLIDCSAVWRISPGKSHGRGIYITSGPPTPPGIIASSRLSSIPAGSAGTEAQTSSLRPASVIFITISIISSPRSSRSSREATAGLAFSPDPSVHFRRPPLGRRGSRRQDMPSRTFANALRSDPLHQSIAWPPPAAARRLQALPSGGVPRHGEKELSPIVIGIVLVFFSDHGPPVSPRAPQFPHPLKHDSMGDRFRTPEQAAYGRLWGSGGASGTGGSGSVRYRECSA